MKVTNKQFGIAAVVFLVAAIGMRSFKEPTPLVEGKPIEYYLEQLQDLDSTTQMAALNKIEVFGPYAVEAFPALIQLSSKSKNEYVLNSIVEIVAKFPAEQSEPSLRQLLSATMDSPEVSENIFQKLLKVVGPDEGAEILKEICSHDLSKVRSFLGAYDIFEGHLRRNALTEISEWLFSQSTPNADDEIIKAKNILAGFLLYEPSNIRLIIIPEEQRQVLRERVLKIAEIGVGIDHGDPEINETLEEVIKIIDPNRGMVSTLARLKAVASQGETAALAQLLKSLNQEFESLKGKVLIDEEKESSMKALTSILNGMVEAARNAKSEDNRGLLLATFLKITTAESQAPIDLSPIYAYASELINSNKGKIESSAVRYLALDGLSKGIISAEKYLEPVVSGILSESVSKDDVKAITYALFAIAQNGKSDYRYATEFVQKNASQLGIWESTELAQWIITYSENQDVSYDDKYSLLTLVRTAFPNSTLSNDADRKLYDIFSSKKVSLEKVRDYIIKRLSEPGGSYASVNPWYGILNSATGQSGSPSIVPPLEAYAMAKEAYALAKDSSVRRHLDEEIRTIERQRNIDPEKVSERLKAAVLSAKTPEVQLEALRTLISSTPTNERKNLIPLTEKILNEASDQKIRAAAIKFIDSEEPSKARIPVLVKGKSMLLRSWDNVRYDVSKLARSATKAEPGSGFLVHDRSVHSRFNSIQLGEKGDVNSEVIFLNEIGVVECAISLSGKKSRDSLCEDPSQYQLFVGPGTIEAFGIKPGDEVTSDYPLLEAIRGNKWNFFAE